MELVKNINRVELSKSFAATVHADQTYDKMSYIEGHLNKVMSILLNAGLDSEDDQCIAYLHDSIEDVDGAMQSVVREFVEREFSPHVYETVWAMTGIGHNRKSRNQNFYEKITNYPHAANYKLADRIANLSASLGSSDKNYFMMYFNEHDDFTNNIYRHATNKILMNQYSDLIGAGE